MQLNLGQKIRELRRRDGRTQEALAETLGVTAQAVSRWESGGSYPDMEMIPAIANYFHISIDELFGYHDDREEKIKNILDKATQVLNKNGFIMQKGGLHDEIGKCLEMLRNAAEEFPTEPKILLKYAQALQMWGWHKFGARGTIDETTGVIEYDVQYNSQNIYWQEALRVYEKIIKLNPVNSDKNNAINNLIDLYSTMGEFEKAKNLAESRDSLIISKEILLAIATKGEEKFRYEAEKIILLLGHLNFSIINYIAIRPSVYSSEYGKELILSILKLYEIIFNDDRYGKWHHEIAQLYLRLTLIEISISGSIENALVYFDKAFDHYKEYNRICLEDEYNYTSPLVSNLPKVKKGDLPPTKEDFWKNEVKNYPESLKDELRKIPKYKECFSE